MPQMLPAAAVDFRTVIDYGGGRRPDGPVTGSYHNGPSLCRAANQDLVISYECNANHGSPNGWLVQNRSKDGGRTWGQIGTSDEIIHAHYSDGTRAYNGSMSTLVNGTMVWVWGHEYMPTGPSRVAILSYSTDSGTTWTDVALPDTQIGPQGFTTAAGKVVEVPAGRPNAGRLLLPVYCNDTGTSANLRYAALLYSDNGPAGPWARLSVMARDPALVNDFKEQHLGYLDDGRIMALYRVDLPVFGVWINYSSDDGQTFGTPTLAFGGNGWPHWIQLAPRRPGLPGIIVACARINNAASNQGLQISLDRGISWTDSFIVGDPVYGPGGGVYAELLDVGGGHVRMLINEERRTTTPFVGPTYLEFMGIDIGKMLIPENMFGTDEWGRWSVDSLQASDPNLSGVDPVTVIPDLSGNGRDLHASAGTVTWRQGTILNTSFPGPVIDLHLGAISLVNLPVGGIPQPAAIVLVVSSNGGNVDFVFDDASVGLAWLRYINGSPHQFQVKNPTGTSKIFNTPAVPPGPAVITVLYDGTNSIVRVNGVTLALASGSTSGTTALTGLVLNHSGSGYNNDLKDMAVLTTRDLNTIGTLEQLYMQKHRVGY